MKSRYIPENVLQGKRFLGFRIPNLIEGVVWALIAFIIICQIPFVKKVKWIMIICIGLFLIIANGIGIKGQRFSVTVINYFKYKPFMKRFSYRRMNYNPEPEDLFVTEKGRMKVVTVHEQTAIGKVEKIFKH